MSHKNQFIGVRSHALFSGAERWEGGRKEKTVWKCKRAVKNINVYTLTRTRRSQRRSRACQIRALAIPIGTLDTRATEMVKIAQRSLVSQVGYVFSTISTYTDKLPIHSHVSTCMLSNESLTPFRAHTHTHTRTECCLTQSYIRHIHTLYKSCREAWTVYKYNETCAPHNITSDARSGYKLTVYMNNAKWRNRRNCHCDYNMLRNYKS